MVGEGRKGVQISMSRSMGFVPPSRVRAGGLERADFRIARRHCAPRKRISSLVGSELDMGLFLGGYCRSAFASCSCMLVDLCCNNVERMRKRLLVSMRLKCGNESGVEVTGLGSKLCTALVLQWYECEDAVEGIIHCRLKGVGKAGSIQG